MDKRYQVFISSTYADLKEERRSVIQAVIELDCIPAGMELFPAADEEQLNFIKRVIDDCDYYLLIVGGRYGSTSETGISYTEQEYDYAIGRGLKVIALLHGNLEEIPLGKSEKDPVLRERLQQFRDRVATGRLVKFWKAPEELSGLVALGLSRTIKMFPAVGWVRANRAVTEDLLVEMNELRKRTAELQEQVADLTREPRLVVEGLAGLDETIVLHGRHSDGHSNSTWEARPTWRQIFAYVSPYLVQMPIDHLVQSTLASALFKASGRYGSYPTMDDQEFRTVAVQLVALGLVKTTYSETVQGGMGLFWSQTPPGEQLMMQVRTVPTKAQGDG